MSAQGRTRASVQQERVRLTSEPVLERHHECSGVSSLVTWEELQNLGKGSEEFQHTLLERGSILLLLLLHEVGYDTFGLSKVLHRETSNLVEAHDLRHGGEDKDGIEVLAGRLDDVDDFFGKFLNKNERTNEHIGISDILLELFVCVVISEFLE
jgi:hypothetical protein